MLFYIAVILLPVLVAAYNDVLFDTSGATPFPRTCDNCYEAVPVNYTYRFFDESYNTIYFGSNGYLTFDEGYGHVPVYTSAFSPAIMLAPFWSRMLHIFRDDKAELSFEETQDSDLLKEATRAIERRMFPRCGDLFEPTSLFIATWGKVTSFCSWSHTYLYDDSTDSYDDSHYDYADYSNYDDYADYFDTCSYYDDHSIPDDYSGDYIDYNDYSDDLANDDFWSFYSIDYADDKRRHTNERDIRPMAQQEPLETKAAATGKSFDLNADKNTFQVVLATDGSDTFAIINFEDIQWWFCTDYNKMLFNAGDDVGFYMNPEVQLSDNTNVHQQGRWVYKISDSKIMGPGCDIMGT